MSDTSNRERFAGAQKRWRKAHDAERTYRLDVLLSRYGQTDPPTYWMTATERRRAGGVPVRAGSRE